MLSHRRHDLRGLRQGEGMSGTKEEEGVWGLYGLGQTTGRAVSTGRSMSAAAIR